MEMLGTLPPWIVNPRPELYLEGNYVVLDFETTNRDKGSALNPANHIVLAGWVEVHRRELELGRRDTPPPAAPHIQQTYAGEYQQEDLRRAIERCDFIVAQNAKFELQWLERIGVRLDGVVVYDTMLGEYVRLGNRRGPLDLDSIAGRYELGVKEHVVKGMIEAGICPSEIPENWLREYNAQDVKLTHEVFLRQRDELSRAGLLPVLYTRCLVTPVLADIEKYGITLDPDRVTEKFNEFSGRKIQLQRELDELAGGINWNSPKQVGGYLYGILGFSESLRWDGSPDRTPSGNRCTDADTIEGLKAETEAQKAFLGVYKAFAPLKRAVNDLTKFKKCCEENSPAIIQAVYNQAVTRNHRMSCTGARYKVQLHNTDRDFKRLFKARQRGWLVGEADAPQLEWRTAAHLTGDPQAAADIRNGVDIHLFTGSIIFNKPEDKITEKLRYEAKTHTFKPVYGGQSGTPAEKRYYKAFQAKYSVLYDVQTEWTYEVLGKKQLRVASGLIFYWPDTKMTKSGYITNKASIFNYPVSSLATAEIIPISLVCFWHRMKSLDLQMFLVNTIHDSVMAELPPEEQDVFISIANVSFTTDTFRYLEHCYGIRFTIPLGAEVKIADHWAPDKTDPEYAGMRKSLFNVDPMELYKDRVV